MLALEETFLLMCQSSRAIIFRFNSKTQWQMFLLLYGRHVCVPQKDANIWRLHTKLYKFGWHSSANNARMKNSRDLILCEVFYISIIYLIPDSWLCLLNGYDFSCRLLRINRLENFRPSKKEHVSRPDSYKKESGRAGFFVIYYFLLHAFFTLNYLSPGIWWRS